MRTLSLLIAVTALSVTALAAPAGAQEPVLPPGAIALVGSEPIPQAEFDHWLPIALRERRGVTDPPGYEGCIAAERRFLRKKGRKPTKRELRLRCERRNVVARERTMAFLLEVRWLRQEAAARQITIAPERVRRYLKEVRKLQFKSYSAYRRFLRKTGLTKADLLVRAELGLIQLRLLVAAVEAAKPVTAKEIKRFYARHPRRYEDKPRAKALRAIRKRLTGLRAANAAMDYLRDFRSRYRGITVCSPAYATEDCGNA